MRILFLLLFWLATIPLSNAQCKAIRVNSTLINQTGSSNGYYNYTISANVTLEYGNASIIPYYRCGSGEEMALDDCFTWESPSTRDFTSDVFRCPCDQPVSIRLEGYASSNCKGNTCGNVEGSESNLALDLTDFRIAGHDADQVCFKWFIDPEEKETRYQIESSIDGIHFTYLTTFTSPDILLSGTAASKCMVRTNYNPYYRMKAIEKSGRALYSPIRSINGRPAQTRILYNMNTREITLSGPDDQLASCVLHVYDAKGRRVYEEVIKGDKVLLPEFPEGIYFIQINRSCDALVKKIVL
ncbi:MAG TPA: T9SS type A sorting domain-containing protein [Saprospiraceae bacterium]|nr:T9SS type A sorting domain-containing protein [Saprospiraceae bacterium]HNT21375.1 T9SS type A sorting domain-containing protein [Saprospiraceae bacterium]